MEDDLEPERLMREAGFNITSNFDWSDEDPQLDFIAIAPNEKRYAIEVLSVLDEKGLQYREDHLGHMVPSLFDELWIVVEYSLRGPPIPRPNAPWMRVIPELEFEKFLEATVPKPKKKNQRRSQRGTPESTKFRKTIAKNRSQLLLSIGSIHALLDEKIKGLQAERPNSPESIRRLTNDIAEYSTLRANLGDALNAVEALSKPRPKQIEQHARAFAVLGDGLERWWKRSHEKILSSAFDTALFGLTLAICHMAGAAPDLSLVISAAMVRGKAISSVLKEAAKKVIG